MGLNMSSNQKDEARMYAIMGLMRYRDIQTTAEAKTLNIS